MSHVLIRQLTGIRDEFEVARTSLNYLERGWDTLHTNTAFADIQKAQVRRTNANLEITYIARLFSEFEAILRSSRPLHSSTLPDRRSAYHLINQTASRLHIRADIRDQAHRVKEFRNHIVHQGSSAGMEISFSDALAALNRFLSWFPNLP